MDISNPGSDPDPYQAPRSPIVGPAPATRRLGVELATLALLGVAALPLTAASSMYVFAFRAALYLGHWPFYGHPDSKDLPDDFHPATEWLSYAGPLLIFGIQVAVARWVLGRRRWRLPIAACLLPVTWLLCYLFVVADPAGVLNWIMD